MRVSALVLIALIGSTSAVASAQSGREGTKKVQKGKKKPKKKKKEKAPEGPNMDSNDPVAREVSDPGQYAPRGATGELKAQQDAEEAAKRPKPRPKEFVAPPHDPLVVFGDFVLGFGEAPRPGPAFSKTTDGTVFSAVLGATFDIVPELSVGALIPWSTASMVRGGPFGNEQEMVFGSPKIFGEYRVKLSPRANVPIQLGVGIPLTPGNPDPNADYGTAEHVAWRKAAVSYHADAVRGWKDGELFAPKRVPVTLSGGLDYHNGALRAYGYDKLIFGIDTGTTLVEPSTPYPSGGRLVVNKVAFRNVLFGGATYDIFQGPDLWAGLDAWLVYDAVKAIDYESGSGAVEPSPFQFVIEPRVGMRFGKLRPNIGFIYPLGGRLGEAGSTAFRAKIDYAF